MARFALEPGEHVVHKDTVGNARDRDAACTLYLTDRRLVLTAIDTKAGWYLFGFLGALLDAGRPARISHQIRRTDFGTVTVTGKREVTVENKGEGYARVWVEISTKRPEEWADRIHRWASGEAGADLPAARVIDRRERR